MSKKSSNIGDRFLAYRYTLSHFWDWALRAAIQDWLLWLSFCWFLYTGFIHYSSSRNSSWKIQIDLKML